MAKWCTWFLLEPCRAAWAWLDGSADEAFALAREYPLEEMRIVQEGFKKDDLPAVQPCWPWRVMQPTSSLSRRN